MKKGDILVSSWGYGQTNITFYEVVDTTPKSVKIVKLSQKVNDMETGNPMSEYVLPSDDFIGDVITKRVKTNRVDGSQYISISDYASARLWNGQPMFQSHVY